MLDMAYKKYTRFCVQVMALKCLMLLSFIIVNCSEVPTETGRDALTPGLQDDSTDTVIPSEATEEETEEETEGSEETSETTESRSTTFSSKCSWGKNACLVTCQSDGSSIQKCEKSCSEVCQSGGVGSSSGGGIIPFPTGTAGGTGTGVGTGTVVTGTGTGEGTSTGTDIVIEARGDTGSETGRTDTGNGNGSSTAEGVVSVPRPSTTHLPGVFGGTTSQLPSSVPDALDMCEAERVFNTICVAMPFSLKPRRGNVHDVARFRGNQATQSPNYFPARIEITDGSVIMWIKSVGSSITARRYGYEFKLAGGGLQAAMTALPVVVSFLPKQSGQKESMHLRINSKSSHSCNVDILISPDWSQRILAVYQGTAKC
ncbi:MAG: hypothetical protein OXC44_05785 [Proteobacteria bacterium]|nr:hypothetical protein [Pseudomonadota bacterium]